MMKLIPETRRFQKNYRMSTFYHRVTSLGLFLCLWTITTEADYWLSCQLGLFSCSKISLNYFCFPIFNKVYMSNKFNSIQYYNENSTVYWRDPININIKSTSQDKGYLVITKLLKYSYIVHVYNKLLQNCVSRNGDIRLKTYFRSTCLPFLFNEF
jgi:hypothetical protein